MGNGAAGLLLRNRKLLLLLDKYRQTCGFLGCCGSFGTSGFRCGYIGVGMRSASWLELFTDD